MLSDRRPVSFVVATLAVLAAGVSLGLLGRSTGDGAALLFSCAACAAFTAAILQQTLP